MEIFILCVVAYLTAWVRLLCHEGAHFVVGKRKGLTPVYIMLGGWAFGFEGRYTWIFGFAPLIGGIAYKQSNIIPAQVYVAGPIADIVSCSVMGALAFFFLPYTASSVVLASCIVLLSSTLASSFGEGQDLYEYSRLKNEL